MSQALISAKGLHKHFGHIHAVNGLDLSIFPGEIYGFLGPNGSGKSTTMRMLLGLVKPDQGEIALFGKPLASHRHRLLGRVGALIEQANFYPYLSGFKNLWILARLSGIAEARSRAMDCLALVGLADRAHDKVKTYSQGMRQRLGIAQTLLHDPELLILDEPTNGLDPKGVVEIRELLLTLNREQGKTLILSSHILQEIEKTASRVLIMYEGKTQAEGEVKTLLGRQNSRLRLQVKQAEKAREVLAQWQDRLQIQAEAEDGQFVLIIDGEDVPLLNQNLVQAGVEVLLIHPSNSLEDYFLSIT